MKRTFINLKTDETIVEDDPNWVPPAVDLESDVRLERNQLLAASDWTQIADAPVDQTAWATYRQALRDVPQQEGFPENVNWPEPPNE